MGQFQKVRDEDHDDDDEERNALVHDDDVEGMADDYGQEHWRPAGLVLGCLTVREGFFLLAASVAFVVLCYSSLSFAVSAIAKRYLLLVTTSAFGTATTVGSVHVGVMDERTTVTDFVIGNPPGFSQGPANPFLTLGEGVLDLRWDTLLSDPWELEEIALTSLMINIEQNPDLSSNAKEIVQRLGTISSMQMEKQSGPRPGQPHYLMDPATTRGLLSVPNKIVVDRLALFDLGIKLCIRPICDSTGPATYVIRRVMVFDIGKQQGGVKLYQLLEIVAQAALVAAIHAAPQELGATLQRSIGQGLRRALDYASVHLDLGSGLMEVRDWTSNQLGRLENTVGTAVAPGGLLSQGALLNDMESLRGNASTALSDLGLELGGAAGHVAEGLEHSADGMRGQKAEAVAEAASTAMNDVSHEAEVLGDRMSEALSALEGSNSDVNDRGMMSDSSFGMKEVQKGELAGSSFFNSLTSGAEEAASELLARQRAEQPTDWRREAEAHM